MLFKSLYFIISYLLYLYLTLRVVNIIPSSPFCKYGSMKSSIKCISLPNCNTLARTTTKLNTGNSSSIVHKYVDPNCFCTAC